MSDAKGLAVQSYCFRGFKADAEVAAKVKACGLAAVELCGVHADFAAPETFERVIRTYRDAGVGIVSIGVQGFKNEAAKEEQFFDFAKRAGATTISANFPPDGAAEAMRTAERLAAEHGIRLAIHNHGGRHWLGSSQMLQAVFRQTGPQIGLMLDTAWALDAGEDPVAMVEKFGDRLYGLHLKDFVFDRARKPQDVVVGTGNLDLPRLFAALRKVGFAGLLILEYEGDVANPVPALRECVEALRKELANV